MSSVSPLIQKIETIGTLSEDEKSAINSLPLSEHEYEKGEVFVQEGDHPQFSILVLTGMVFRFKIAHDQRQIMSFHIRGDMPDLHGLFVEVLDHSLAVANCPTRIAKIPHAPLSRFLRENVHIAELLWRETFIDASIFGEWIVNNGRRRASPRLAHLLCEAYTRAEAVGLVKDGICPLPLTQYHLSDATGLSNVHLNRSLQDLRSRGFLEFKNGSLKISNWDRLAEYAEFDEQYLHIKRKIPPIAIGAL